MKTESEIDRLDLKSGKVFYSAWLWCGEGESRFCFHVGHFETEYQAERAIEGAELLIEKTRRYVRSTI